MGFSYNGLVSASSPHEPRQPLGSPPRSIHAAPLLPAGQAWAISAHMGGGAGGYSAPRPTLHASGRPSSRPAVHAAKATAPPPVGGWRPRKRHPHWVSARLFMPFNGCRLGRKCSEGILEDMGYLTNVSKSMLHFQ